MATNIYGSSSEVDVTNLLDTPEHCSNSDPRVILSQLSLRDISKRKSFYTSTMYELRPDKIIHSTEHSHRSVIQSDSTSNISSRDDIEGTGFPDDTLGRTIDNGFPTLNEFRQAVIRDIRSAFSWISVKKPSQHIIQCQSANSSIKVPLTIEDYNQIKNWFIYIPTHQFDLISQRTERHSIDIFSCYPYTCKTDLSHKDTDNSTMTEFHQDNRQSSNFSEELSRFTLPYTSTYPISETISNQEATDTFTNSSTECIVAKTPQLTFVHTPELHSQSICITDTPISISSDVIHNLMNSNHSGSIYSSTNSLYTDKQNILESPTLNKITDMPPFNQISTPSFNKKVTLSATNQSTFLPPTRKPAKKHIFSKNIPTITSIKLDSTTPPSSSSSVISRIKKHITVPPIDTEESPLRDIQLLQDVPGIKDIAQVYNLRFTGRLEKKRRLGLSSKTFFIKLNGFVFEYYINQYYDKPEGSFDFYSHPWTIRSVGQIDFILSDEKTKKNYSWRADPLLDYSRDSWVQRISIILEAAKSLYKLKTTYKQTIMLKSNVTTSAQRYSVSSISPIAASVHSIRKTRTTNFPVT